MRSLFVFPLMAIAALAQPVSFGVRAGVPLTDFAQRVLSPAATRIAPFQAIHQYHEPLPYWTHD